MGSEFPGSADEFLEAVEDLFRNQYMYFVMDHDITDDTYLVHWVDRKGTERKSWLTQSAMDQLSIDQTFN
jgi:hypothetical protein